MNQVKIWTLLLVIVCATAPLSARHKKKKGKPSALETGLSVQIQLSEPKAGPAIPVKPLRRPDSLLYWSTTLILSWDDYWGKPDPKSQLTAFSSWQITLQQANLNSGNTPDVLVALNRYQCWKNPKKQLTSDALIHEKVHFNIAELYARKIRKAYSFLDSANPNLKAEVNATYNNLLAAARALDAQYDKETENGNNTDQQRQWNMKVSSQMSELSSFASQ